MADGLNAIVVRAKEAKQIKGLPVTKKKKQTNVTSLQCVDDTTIFGQPNIKEAIIWKWILHTFER